MAACGRLRLGEFCRRRLGLDGAPVGAGDWLAAGQRLHGLGEREAALAAFEAGADLEPGNAEAWMAVATLRAELDRPEAALAAAQRALALAPAHPGAWLNLGLLWRIAGDFEKASACVDQALAVEPALPAALLTRGQIFAARQQLDLAAEAFAACLDSDPAHADAAFGLADVDLARGDFAAAASRLEALLELRPDWAEARIALAVAAVGQGDEDRADALLAQARRDDPAACAAYRPFFSADRLGGVAVLDAWRFRVAMEFATLYQCRWSQRSAFVAWLENTLLDARRGARLDDPDSPFPILSLAIDGPARLNLARHVARRIAAAAGPPLRRPARRPGGRIRLGYLTGDLREHPIGRLASRLFGLHDRERFEIFVYHTGPREDCAPRRRAETEADTFRDVARLSERALAALIAADGIDIAVDLSGYTLFNRLGALALRPAPLQVAYLGYFGTLGADFIDYTLADRTVLLPAVRPFWQEAVAYLPDCFFLCDDTLQPPAGTVSRADFGLPGTGFVFACLNSTWKIEPAVFDVWMRILARVPGSVLWLFDGGSPLARQNLAAAALARGIDGGRLVFADHAPYEDYLRRYQVVDLVLNTLTYNGNTTTVEALAMGVPVLTLAGVELPSRTAAGLLLAHGLPDLVVETLEAYEAQAVGLAGDGTARAELRRRIGGNRSASRLFCTERRVREIESALAAMWARHQAGLPPADFDVPPVG